MIKIELKTPYLWLLFFLWVVWGQFVSYCILENYVPGFVLEFADAIGGFVPSVTRLRDHYAFGVVAARRIASLSLALTPLLFLLLLLADVEETVTSVRKRRGGAKVATILVVLGLGMFVAGFGYRVPGFPQRLFYTNAIAFSFLSSLLTYLSTSFLRLAWGLRSNRSKGQESFVI